MSDAMDWLAAYVSLREVHTVRVSRGSSTSTWIPGQKNSFLFKTWVIRVYVLCVNAKGQVVHKARIKVWTSPPHYGYYRSYNRALDMARAMDLIVCQCKGIVTEEWAEVLQEELMYQNGACYVRGALDLEIAAEAQEARYQARKAACIARLAEAKAATDVAIHAALRTMNEERAGANDEPFSF